MTDVPRLISGPYRPPAGRPYRAGRTVGCKIRGEVTVTGISDAPIPWPIARAAGRPRQGLPVVTPELERAIRTESRQAIAYWWGVSISTAWRWRRALAVPRYNPGTVERWRELGKTKLTEEGRRKGHERMRRAIRRRRERPRILHGE